MVTDVVDGDSLEAALRDYGPAAIDDLLPRLRTIAEALDAAHAAGQIHGSLHPQNIFVSADHTFVDGLDKASAAAPAVRPPYSAPEVAGGDAQPASDQFSLAAIAFEWMFGRRIAGPAKRQIDVRALPGVDRDALSDAFTRALAPQAADRFASCTAFCGALEAAVIPALPLGADEDAHETEFLRDDEPAAPIEVEIEAAAPPPAITDLALDDDDHPLASMPAFEPALSPPVEPVTSWQPSAAYTPAKTAERFSGTMLIVAALVTGVVGFAAGYMARPRALQSGPLASASRGAAENASGGAGQAGGAGKAGEAGRATPGTDGAIAPTSPPQPAPAPQPAAPAQSAQPAPQAQPVPSAPGRLLVRSTPAGASVEVDGVARGVTPLALRDLELGSRTITVTRRGYIAEEQRVALTRARPSRSLELRLTAEPAAAAPGRSGAVAPKPAATRAGGSAPARVGTGSLLIESRPAGAAVTVDGTPRGVTPVTLEALPPGDYRIGLSLAGYQPFATTVRVVAGERTRAAASLSVQE